MIFITDTCFYSSGKNCLHSSRIKPVYFLLHNFQVKYTFQYIVTTIDKYLYSIHLLNSCVYKEYQS